MWKIEHPTTGIVHAVRNRRTDMILGLECGKAGSFARSIPTDRDITCPTCAERTALAGALTGTATA